MKSFLSFFLAMLIGSLAYASDIKARLSVPKRIYGPGEQIQFHIMYTNASNRAVRFIPETVVYPTDLFEVRQANRQEHVKPNHYGFLSLDFEEQARSVKVLAPGSSAEDTITANVATRLPDYFHDKRHGLFVVFPASAFRLPREGDYIFTLIYRAGKDEPAMFYLHRDPPVWMGETRSNPVGITFRY